MVFAAALCLGVLFARPLWAIPSPDLVVSFFASAGQVLGLLSVGVLGFGYSLRRQRKGRESSERPRTWILAVCFTILFCSLAANILQYTYHVDHENQRLRANLTRSSTEAGKAVGDVNLKALSFSEQATHPNGIETATLVQWLNEGRQLNLVDVREPEEVEQGRIAGSWHIRYPDLLHNPKALGENRGQTVLLCYSGNRSSELTEELARTGQRCMFMIGGYEKWIAEGRPLAMAEGRAPGTLRDIPDYPGKTELLDTPLVEEFVAQEKAVFVDVRYPGDFQTGHLPGAINIPLRCLTTGELWPRLMDLPRVPIVAPCYDKRSSFYASILGLRLHRLGYDFRGLYTVPHEFTPPPKLRPHVAQWLEAQKQESLLAWLSRPFQKILRAVAGRIDDLALAILAVAVLLRLLFLPFSVKAERDGVVQRRLAPDLNALRERLGHDPQRLSRALVALRRKENITPVVNLVVTSIQILIFLVFFSAVDAVAALSDQAFLWMPALRSPDPYHILPVIIGGLVFLFLHCSSASRHRWRHLIHLAAGLVLAALTLRLRAAVNMYLVASLAVLFVQSRLTRCYLTRRWIRHQREYVQPRKPVKQSGIVMLQEAHRVPGTGKKASRLGQLHEAGLPVPPGFVLPEHVICRDGGTHTQKSAQAGTDFFLSPQEKRQVARAFRRLCADRVAVRSSGANEDGAEQSFAGVFESVLNVRRKELGAALASVRASLRSPRAQAYGGNDQERGGVIVQAMVTADYSGVLFTEHPRSTGSCLVELVSGVGEALVSGAVTPESYRFGRRSGQLMGPKRPPIDLAPLLKLGRTVEELFGRPQDIEWAYAEGRFLLLQARDVTRSIRDGTGKEREFERERERLLRLAKGSPPAETVFAENELSGLLPRPTPLSLSLMERLWEAGGAADLACRSLGIPYGVEEDSSPLLVSVFGRLYVDRREEARRLGRPPGPVAGFKLARVADRLRREFREIFLPPFLDRMCLREAMDFSRLTLQELIGLFKEWIDQFVTQTYVEAERVNVAADFYVKSAAQQLTRRNLNAGSYLSRMPQTIVHRAMKLLASVKQGDRDVEEFLILYGHRAPQDYELSQPRYRENPKLLHSVIAQLPGTNRDAVDVSAAAEDDFVLRERHPVLASTVGRARYFQTLKEEAKHHCLRELATLRAVTAALGIRAGVNGGIFYLTLDEIPRLKTGSFRERALGIIKRRRNNVRDWRFLELPGALSIRELECLGVNGQPSPRCSAAHSLRGTWVSGDKELVGRVRIVRSPDQLGSIGRGEVLVARLSEPAWVPAFSRIAGIITEVGGWLSHAAIVAREYKIPAIVGAEGALDALKTGDVVRMRPNGGIERVRANGRKHNASTTASPAPPALNTAP